MKTEAKKQEEPARPEPKPPIYPVSVIEVACRALEALVAVAPAIAGENFAGANGAAECALRIIRDGLASHEKAIRGES